MSKASIRIVGIPALLALFMILLANSVLFQRHPQKLSFGITLDLVFTIPLVYIFLTRKMNISKTTAIPIFITGIFLAGLIIPRQEQFLLTLIKTWVLPGTELIVFYVLVIKIRNTFKSYKIQKGLTPDFYTALKNACDEILPKRLSAIVTTEAAVFYYTFFCWKKRSLHNNEFSYHKNSGITSILVTIIFLILAETTIVHILIQKWNVTVAWIISAIGFYGILQILSLVRSMSKRPIAIEGENLELRYGIFGESSIPLADIDSIELSSKDMELNTHARKLSILGSLESHNVIIHLKKESTLIRLYGLKTSYRTIALFADEKERFEKMIRKCMNDKVR